MMLMNETELRNVSRVMQGVVQASRAITTSALDDATGTNWEQRRAAVDRRIDAWRDRHYHYVPCNDRRPAA